jgi:hypothetical protein
MTSRVRATARARQPRRAWASRVPGVKKKTIWKCPKIGTLLSILGIKRGTMPAAFAACVHMPERPGVARRGVMNVIGLKPC